MKSKSKKRTPNIVNLTVKRLYLTQREVERLMDCARKHGRYGHRDAIHPHMLRHPCGFKLANDGHDTRALQHYLGHKTFSTRSGTPKWRPIGSRTFGGDVDD